jgi:RNase P/RNase MRP subunit p30
MNSEYILITETDFNKIRLSIKKNQDKKIIFSSNDDELDRKVLEKEKINVLLLNQAGRKDFQKQRNSGFNQVLAKAAKKKDVAIGINLDEIINSNGKVRIESEHSSSDKSCGYSLHSQKEKARILARVQQNIKLCNKNKVNMKFIAQEEKNERNIHDLKALGLVLGMPTWMTKEL